MGPYARGVLFVIRLVAAAFIVIGLMQAGSVLFYKAARQPVGIMTYLIKGWAAYVGIVIWIVGPKISRAVTRDLED